MNDRLRIKAPGALPVELMTELKEAKAEVLTELRRNSKTRPNAGFWKNGTGSASRNGDGFLIKA